jgi:hypothetical protein
MITYKVDNIKESISGYHISLTDPQYIIRISPGDIIWMDSVPAMVLEVENDELCVDSYKELDKGVKNIAHQPLIDPTNVGGVKVISGIYRTAEEQEVVDKVNSRFIFSDDGYETYKAAQAKLAPLVFKANPFWDGSEYEGSLTPNRKMSPEPTCLAEEKVRPPDTPYEAYRGECPSLAKEQQEKGHSDLKDVLISMSAFALTQEQKTNERINKACDDDKDFQEGVEKGLEDNIGVLNEWQTDLFMTSLPIVISGLKKMWK